MSRVILFQSFLTSLRQKTIQLQNSMDQHVQRIIDLAFIETKGGAKVYHILPLFGNDTSRHLNIDFTQFFRRIYFNSEISEVKST